MRRMVYTLMACSLMWTSCVYDEVISNNSQQQETAIIDEMPAVSRSTDNVLVVGGSNASYSSIDWSGDYHEGMGELVDENGASLIFAYDGKGGKMTVENSRPAISYSQDGVWTESGFRYAVSDVEDLYKNGMQLQWKDAFAAVSFQIRNEIESLHLQVRGIRLVHVAVDGTFYFPYDGESAEWVVDNTRGSLELLTDTLDIEPGAEVSMISQGLLPVIPQQTESWDVNRMPGMASGTLVLVDCRIYQMLDAEKGYAEGGGYVVWGDSEGGFAEAAIPVSLNTVMGETSVITLTLDEACGWYNISGWKPEKVLRPIEFSPSVEDWENGGNVNINN